MKLFVLVSYNYPMMDETSYPVAHPEIFPILWLSSSIQLKTIPVLTREFLALSRYIYMVGYAGSHFLSRGTTQTILSRTSNLPSIIASQPGRILAFLKRCRTFYRDFDLHSACHDISDQATLHSRAVCHVLPSVVHFPHSTVMTLLYLPV